MVVPPKQLDPNAARTCLLTNLLVLPGMGSLMAGRRAGWVQIALAVAGLVLTPAYLIDTAKEWQRSGKFVCQSNGWLIVSLVGVALFVIAWLWALATALAIRRTTRSQ